MHQERNVAERIINMCVDIIRFSKYYINTWKDLAALCNCPSLEPERNAKINLKRPRAPNCLKLAEREDIVRWLKKFKFLDRYASNIKRAVNVSTGKLNGLKSHNYHIIMEVLMSVMFCGYFNNPIAWIYCCLRTTMMRPRWRSL
jgi:hypothetical protein